MPDDPTHIGVERERGREAQLETATRLYERVSFFQTHCTKRC